MNMRIPRGKIVPIISLQWQPTIDWLQTVAPNVGTRRNARGKPAYGGSEVELVILHGEANIADPTTKDFAIFYKSIKLAGDCVLTIVELADSSLWSILTETQPASVTSYSGWNRRPDDNWMTRRTATACRDLIGPLVDEIVLLHRPDTGELALHRARLPADRVVS
jgi:hypothetical protein